MKQKVFFILALLFGLLAPQVAKAYNFSAVAPTGQTLYYYIIGNNVVVTYPNYDGSYGDYSGYTKPSGDLEIPSSVTDNGTTYTVTSIGGYAFSDCSGLTSVTIPNSVTNIGYCAFLDCIGLTSVTIPNSVTGIGEYAFCGCTGLTSVTIPNSVTDIGRGAFYDCSGLTSVTIPNSVTSIGYGAFYGCTGLTSVTIPNSVTSIEAWAFGNCSGLTSVTIGNSVTSLNLGTFQGCTGLTSVTLGNSVTSIGQQAFYGCIGLTSVTIPNSVTSIGSSAFSKCSGLTGTLTIPNSVTSIGRNAFDSCVNLQSVVLPNNLSKLDTSVFRYCIGLTNVTIPNSVTSIGAWAFIHCSGLTNITIPDSVTSIGYYAFSDCTSLTSVTIPNSVTSIGEDAFYGCIGLHVLDLGSGLTSVGANAFYNCDHLDSIYSRSTTPPTVANTNAFENVWKGLPLTVPTGSRSAYAVAYAWRDFTNIVEMSAAQFTVTVNVNDASMGTVSGGGSYALGATVTLTATPNTGYHFVQWNDGTTTNPRTVTVTANATYTAIFAPDQSQTQYTVTVAANDATMGYVTGGGSYTSGATATLTATANAGYHFVQWNDGNTTNPRTVTVTDNATYMALFEADQSDAPQIAYVGVDANGHNSVCWTPRSGSAAVSYRIYREGTQAGVYEQVGIVQATGAAAYTWSDDQSNPAVRAYGYRLTEVAADGTESAQSAPHTTMHLQINQGQGGAWNLTWTPYAGFAYSTYRIYRGATAASLSLLTTLPASSTTYSDLTAGGVNYYYQIEVVQLGSSKSVTGNSRSNIANSDPEPQRYTLTVLSADITRGTVTGGGSYEQGETATLEAQAAEGFVFLQWQDGSTANPRTITVTADATYMAYFAASQGIGDAEADDVVLTVVDGRVTISGAEGRRVALVDALGRTLYRGTATEQLTIDVPATGVYLLQVDDRPAKRIAVVR